MNTPYTSDEFLVKSCLAKDIKAQKELVQSYAPVLLTIARRYDIRHIEPEDILQESFILIFKNLHQYNENKGKLIQWMSRIVINTALKMLRDQKIKIVNEPITENLNNFPSLWDDSITEQYKVEHWIHLIAELPNVYKTIFNLFEIDGYTHEEIAVQLNIPESTSRSYLHRARKMICEKIILLNSSNYV